MWRVLIRCVSGLNSFPILRPSAKAWPYISQRRRSWQQGSPGAPEKGADLEQASDGRHPCPSVPSVVKKSKTAEEGIPRITRTARIRRIKQPALSNRPASHDATRSNTAAPTGRFAPRPALSTFYSPTPHSPTPPPKPVQRRSKSWHRECYL